MVIPNCSAARKTRGSEFLYTKILGGSPTCIRPSHPFLNALEGTPPNCLSYRAAKLSLATAGFLFLGELSRLA